MNPHQKIIDSIDAVIASSTSTFSKKDLKLLNSIRKSLLLAKDQAVIKKAKFDLVKWFLAILKLKDIAEEHVKDIINDFPD